MIIFGTQFLQIMAVFNQRVEFSRKQLINHYLRRNSLSEFLYSIVRLLGIVIQNIYCISSYLILSWIVLLPISWLRTDLYQKVENYLYNSLLFIVSSWSLTAEATVVEAGDEYKHLIEEPEKYLVEKNRACRKLINGYCDDFIDQEKQHNSDRKKQDIEWPSCKSSTNARYMLHDYGGQQSSEKFEEQNVVPKSDLNYSDGGHGGSSYDRSSLNFSGKDCNNVKFPGDLRAVRDSIINNTGESQGDLVKHTEKSPIINTISSPFGDHGKPKILFLCNHVSTADVPLIMQSFSTLANQSILWVLDAQFKPTNFGLVCSSHGDYFIAKNTFATGSIRDHALKYPGRNIYVLFPEGGFFRKRLEGSNRYAIKNGLPMTKYVTHPRFGAFKDLIDRSVGVTHIVDATLLYDDIKNPLSILDIALGNRKEPAILNYKVYSMSEINPTEEWLRSIWLEKDKLLQQYYEDRSKVYNRLEGTLRAANLNWLKLLSVHLFYLLVCYLSAYRLFSATTVTMSKARDLYYSNI